MFSWCRFGVSWHFIRSWFSCLNAFILLMHTGIFFFLFSFFFFFFFSVISCYWNFETTLCQGVLYMHMFLLINTSKYTWFAFFFLINFEHSPRNFSRRRTDDSFHFISFLVLEIRVSLGNNSHEMSNPNLWENKNNNNNKTKHILKLCLLNLYPACKALNEKPEYCTVACICQVSPFQACIEPNKLSQ